MPKSRLWSMYPLSQRMVSMRDLCRYLTRISWYLNISWNTPYYRTDVPQETNQPVNDWTTWRPEIGVRMALGATPAAVARLILGHAARWTLAGAALGVAASWFAGRLLETMLFHVSARDPWTLAAAVAALSAIALLAAWIPSRRAAKVDPLEALRQE